MNALAQRQDFKSIGGNTYLKAMTMPEKRGAARQAMGIRVGTQKDEDLPASKYCPACHHPKDERVHCKSPLCENTPQEVLIAREAFLAFSDLQPNPDVRNPSCNSRRTKCQWPEQLVIGSPFQASFHWALRFLLAL